MAPEDLLDPPHPLAQLHRQQVQLLRIGNAAYCYHQQVQDRLTEADFTHWLAGLPTRLQRAMATAGFEAARGNWAFRRHVLERHDIGYQTLHAKPALDRRLGLSSATRAGGTTRPGVG